MQLYFYIFNFIYFSIFFQMINMELQPTYSGYAQPQSNLHQPTTPPRHQPLKLHFDDTLCPICKFRTETPMQIHYGGQACFSCRAFFRYVHIYNVKHIFMILTIFSLFSGEHIKKQKHLSLFVNE